MVIHRSIVLAAILNAGLITSMSGCGSSTEPEAPAEPPPVKDTVFGDMVGTMDKARGVQDTVDAHKRDLDQRMQSTEGEQ